MNDNGFDENFEETNDAAENPVTDNGEAGNEEHSNYPPRRLQPIVKRAVPHAPE